MRSTILLGLLGAMAFLIPATDASTFLKRSLNEWRDDLEKPDRPDLRRSAAFALGQIGAPAGVAIDKLIDHAKNDKDPGVREMAARAVGDIVAGIRTTGKSEREWAIAGKALEAALKDTDPRVRRSAAYALGSFGDLASESTPALRVALRDKTPTVRQNAAWAIGKIGDPGEETVRELCSLLGDDSPLVRRLTAGALAEVTEKKEKKPPEVALALMKMLKKEEDDVVCRTGLGALARIADETMRKQASDLYRLLEDSKDPETVRATAFVLAKMGGEPAMRAVPVLCKALADPDPGVQMKAAASLANAGSAAHLGVEALAETLGRSKNVQVRRNCVVALGLINQALRSDRSPRIDRTAPVALAALMKAIEVKPATEDDAYVARVKEQVREDAVEAIANIGYPNNEKAFPLIVVLLREEKNQNLRMRCVWAVSSCHELDRHADIKKALLEVLDETSAMTVNVRLNAARYIALSLREKAPDRTTKVLLDMLGNTGLKVRYGSETSVDGIGTEGKAGGARVTMRWGGDARYMAAEALGWMGSKLKDDAKVKKALEAAAKDPDPKLSMEAKKALEAIEK